PPFKTRAGGTLAEGCQDTDHLICLRVRASAGSVASAPAAIAAKEQAPSLLWPPFSCMIRPRFSYATFRCGALRGHAGMIVRWLGSLFATLLLIGAPPAIAGPLTL